MKKMILFAALAFSLVSSNSVNAQQDKSKRPSPPATVSNTNKGLTITIDYSQPSVKGRTMGKDIATYGKVWRTGANEATTFEVNKDVKVEGKPLPAGKYSLYTIPGEDSWTIIFNKTWKQWGTVYKEEEDALRVQVTPKKSKTFTEQMTFALENNLVTLMWGDTQVSFSVK